jgi:hypothetical protein
VIHDLQYSRILNKSGWAFSSSSRSSTV